MYIILSCGPGYPFLDQLNGCLSLSRSVYYLTLCSWISNFGATERLSIVAKRCILSYIVVLDIQFWGDRTTVYRGQEMYIILPCGPGYPFLGQPNGCLSKSRSVYSCSMPNQGFESLANSITFRQWFLLLVSKTNISLDFSRWYTIANICL